MHTLFYRSSLVVLIAAVGALAIPAPALASTQRADASSSGPTVASTPLGTDVSWPQCGALSTDDRAFAIVGVNHGKANNTNDCSADELAWANDSNGTIAQPKASVYVNTGNPGLAGSWWPSSNNTQSPAQAPDPESIHVANPRGTCAHKAGAACAFVYGYSMGYWDWNARGISNPTAYRWWLDVETGNTWSTDTSANTAAIEGMYQALADRGAEVGLYSTALQWKTIAGATSSKASIAGLPTWLAGASTATSAAADCVKAGLTPGSIVTLVQFVSASTDLDVFCAPFDVAPTPTFTGANAIGKTLTATAGTWSQTPTLKDQWLRNGVAISGATSHTYKTTTADAGKNISVRTTATKAGFAVTTRISSSLLIGKKLTATPVPKISGSAQPGGTLSATAGIWSPSPVTLSYPWKRNGVAIDGATAKTYKLTAADAKKSITVAVTGTKSGYTTVAKGSAAKTIRS